MQEIALNKITICLFMAIPLSDPNLSVYVDDGAFGSGLALLEIWNGPPVQGGTPWKTIPTPLDSQRLYQYYIDHTYGPSDIDSFDFPQGQICVRAFDGAGNNTTQCFPTQDLLWAVGDRQSAVFTSAVANFVKLPAFFRRATDGEAAGSPPTPNQLYLLASMSVPAPNAGRDRPISRQGPASGRCGDCQSVSHSKILTGSTACAQGVSVARAFGAQDRGVMRGRCGPRSEAERPASTLGRLLLNRDGAA